MSAREMYKNRNGTRNNIAGLAIRQRRLLTEPRLSQRALADKMQLVGIDLDKNAVQRIESGDRFITDIELLGFAKILNTPVAALLGERPED